LRKTIKRKNRKTIKRKISHKGGIKSSDGFMIEVDGDGIPLNGSLNYENAELFIKNFLFTEEFIKTYLETDKYIAELMSLKYLNLRALYSGDEAKLNNLLEQYMKTYPDLFLKIFKIMDPKNHAEFIKNLYKSKSKSKINSSTAYRPEISVSTGGGKSGVKEESSEYVFKPMSLLSGDSMVDIPLDDDAIASFAPAPLAPAPLALAPPALAPAPLAPAAFAPAPLAPTKKGPIDMLCLAISSLFKSNKKKINIEKFTEGEAAAPIAFAPIALAEPIAFAPIAIAQTTLSRTDRRHVVTFNLGKTFKQFITKLTIIPKFLLNYTEEFGMYESLRGTLLGQRDNPNLRLENFFRWQNEKVPFISASVPILINLNFTYDDIPIFKQINLNEQVDKLETNIANNSVPVIDNKLEWGALNGVYNPMHVDFRRIVRNMIYANINTDFNKIKTGLEYIFNNLDFFYLRTGFLHCDFKTDNILVETNDDITAITNSFMFDLDLSKQIPEDMYYYNFSLKNDKNRSVLDSLIVPARLVPYLKITNSKSTTSVGFLHFFDCYMATLTLISDAKSVSKMSVINKAIESIGWVKDDPYHSINIFKTCYDLIIASGIDRPNVGDVKWGNLTFESINNVVNSEDIKSLFPAFSEQKKLAYRWIIRNLSQTIK
jgi:hypothetical protein